MSSRKVGKKPINYKLLCIIIVFGLYFVVQVVSALNETKASDGTITYNELFEMLDNGKVDKIYITENQTLFKVIDKDGKTFEAVNPKSDAFIEKMMLHGGNVVVQKKTFGEALTSIIVLMPLIIIMAVFTVYISTTMMAGNTKMFTLIKPKENNVTFDSIKGLSETKKEVQFAVEQMRNIGVLSNVGARPCKGILLYGPPGTGKTLIAKAIANEAGVPFISASGSDFNEMFVGVGASRVRHLWDMAAHNAPCILFIDELDCVGKRRRGGDGASSEYNQTINALLQKMDGLNKESNIMVIAATNMKESLDPALLRPGRFDRHYFIGAPDNKNDRDEMVEFYLRNKLLKKDEIDVESASKLLVGFTGAEVEEILNEAVYISLQDNRNGVIKLSDVDEAVMKHCTGGVRVEHSSDRDREVVAYHEAGHTIVNLVLNIPISKVSIVPYSSGAGGMTMRDLDKLGEHKMKFKWELENEICTLLAGRAAERLHFGDTTPGCLKDLEEATKLIYQMVAEWGLYNNLVNENTIIEMGVNHIIEKETVKKCNDLLNEYDKKTDKILQENKELLEKLVKMLLDKKTVVCPTLESIKNS